MLIKIPSLNVVLLMEAKRPDPVIGVVRVNVNSPRLYVIPIGVIAADAVVVGAAVVVGGKVGSIPANRLVVCCNLEEILIYKSFTGTSEAYEIGNDEGG